MMTSRRVKKAVICMAELIAAVTRFMSFYFFLPMIHLVERSGSLPIIVVFPQLSDRLYFYYNRMSSVHENTQYGLEYTVESAAF